MSSLCEGLAASIGSSSFTDRRGRHWPGPSDAAKPVEQMQNAGMRTARPETIVRQQDPALLAAMEKLSCDETAEGIPRLQQQSRVRQIVGRGERIRAIAKDYAAYPENTIIVSPDNATWREINKAVCSELQQAGAVSFENQFSPHSFHDPN